LSIAIDIADRMAGMPESSTIAMRIKVDTYFDILQGLLDNFLREKDLECIYITSTIPAQSIINALKVLDIDIDRIHFVDCVAHILMGAAREGDNINYVESPTMLEDIMLKVEYLMKLTKDSGKGKLVLLDSINSLSIHNSTKILSEFLHVMVNNLRSKNAYTVILTISEQSNEDINNITNYVCDDTIIVEESE